MGKSAIFPTLGFQTLWRGQHLFQPDDAATMVTAGVFLVVRCSPLYEFSETALSIITVIGMVTAIFAASVALVQNDIKNYCLFNSQSIGLHVLLLVLERIMSQFFICLRTHFLKHYYFLLVRLYIPNDEQDITKMGGIWKKYLGQCLYCS